MKAPSLAPRLFLIATLGAFLLQISPAQGQDNVRLQFPSFPRERDPKPVELLVGGKGTIEVDIPSNQLSQAYTVPRSATWIVGETAAGPQGIPVFNEYGHAPALNSPSQLLLLIRKGENYSDGFVVLPLDNRVASSGGGRFLFMNAAGLDIAGEVGGEKFVVRPGTHRIIRPRVEAESDSFGAMFYFRAEDQARPFFSSRWPVTDTARSLVFSTRIRTPAASACTRSWTTRFESLPEAPVFPGIPAPKHQTSV